MLNKLFWIQITLICLKITSVINYNWLLILSPLALYVLFVFSLYFVSIIFYTIHSKGNIIEAWELLITDLDIYLEDKNGR